ncbi:hypothetical protein TRAPUB_9886 [Trametes pubescens]|uniref:Uncharacterized protein n=1 Tax=Trametes pubescens TaxID=154538 RepID=A0A1M2W1B5_TRAPU|nr:hypothetical protein TRAPUB_9886 [Trametes pubescens]
MPIRPFYLGESPASPSHFRPQSMSQANLQSPSQRSSTASPTQQKHAANRQSMPPQRVTSTSPPAVDPPHSAGLPRTQRIAEEPELSGGEEQEDGEDDGDDDDERAGRKRKGTMSKNFRFPPPSPTQAPPVPPVPHNSTVSPPLVSHATDEAPLPPPPQTDDAEGAEEDADADPELTTVGMVAPSSVEVPPPPPVEKERSLASANDLADDDLGETEEISLN